MPTLRPMAVVDGQQLEVADRLGEHGVDGPLQRSWRPWGAGWPRSSPNGPGNPEAVGDTGVIVPVDDRAALILPKVMQCRIMRRRIT